MNDERIDEVTIRRYTGSSECEVLVDIRGQQLVLRCRDYNQAVKWARIESKSYKIEKQISVELIASNPVPTGVRSIRDVTLGNGNAVQKSD